MKAIPVLATSLLALLIGCSKNDANQGARPDRSATGNPVTAPVDYLGAVAKAKKAAEKTVDLSSIQRSIQLFYAQEDRFPRNLDELVAERYIATVPPAPAGTQWAYNPQTGELKAIAQR